MRSKAVANTHFGNKRTSNEDVYLIDDAMGLYIVCDGSHEGEGQWAASTACQEIQTHLKAQFDVIKKHHEKPSRELRLEIEKLLTQAIQLASQKIYKEIKTNPKHRGALTTVEVLLVLSDCALIGHVGNSRTYWMRQKKSHLLTKDHTHFDEMLQSGLWPVEKINPRYRKVLTRSLGTSETVMVELIALAIAPGDLFLLCTDGLSDHLSKSEQGGSEEFLQLGQTLAWDQLPKALVEAVFKKGGTDNITSLVVQIEPSKEIGTNLENSSAKKQLDALRKIPIFEAIKNDDKSLLKIQNLITPLSLKKGQVVVEQGKMGEDLFIVMSGKANVIINGEVIATCSEGGVIGEMGLFTHSPRSATVITTIDSYLSRIKRTDFLQLLRREPDLGLKISFGVIADLAKKLQLESESMASLKSSTKV